MGKGEPLFQQYVTHENGTSEQLGWIATDYIVGENFRAPSAFEWDKLTPDERVNYSVQLRERLKQIPDEHWDQLIKIYTIAEQKGIRMDFTSSNFIYDQSQGFRAIDYYSTEDFPDLEHHSVYDAITRWNYGAIVVGSLSNRTAEFVRNILERRLAAIESQPDTAMVANNGGIDLNANEKTLEETGDKIKLPVPTDNSQWNDFKTTGFVPVIINISAPVSLPVLLGAATPTESSESISVSSVN